MEPPCRAPDVALTELYDGGRETQGDGCGWSEEVRTSLGLLGPWSWRPHTFREQGRSKACLRGVRSRRKISSRMVVILALVVSGTMALAQSLNESQNISEIVRNDTESNITEAEERDVEEESLQQRPEPGFSPVQPQWMRAMDEHLEAAAGAVKALYLQHLGPHIAKVTDRLPPRAKKVLDQAGKECQKRVKQAWEFVKLFWRALWYDRDGLKVKRFWWVNGLVVWWVLYPYLLLGTPA